MRMLTARFLLLGVMMGTIAWAEPVRIMPLGDSLTEGGYNQEGQWRVGPGFRGVLYDQLVHQGFNIDFVGSVASGPADLFDRDHEGHSGWRIDQLTSGIAAWFKKA